MAFTFQALNEENTAAAAEINLILDPTTAIFTETNWVGNSAADGTINVENDSPVDIRYYVSCDWGPGDNPQDARLLAERLQMTVTADPDDEAAVLYGPGSLAGLIQQLGTGRLLAAAGDEDVLFELALPTALATDLIQGMDIEFDLVFVAVAEEEDDENNNNDG